MLWASTHRQAYFRAVQSERAETALRANSYRLAVGHRGETRLDGAVVVAVLGRLAGDGGAAGGHEAAAGEAISARDTHDHS